METSARRPWCGHLRVSLRGLFVFVLIIGSGLGSIVRSAGVQQDAVAVITRRGHVAYDHERSPMHGSHIWRDD